MDKIVLLIGIACIAALAADETKVLYQNDFQKSPLGALPDDMMVLAGAFAVSESGTNKFVELPGAPLETFGVLFGPAEREDVSVSAQIRGTNKGRRLPSFAVGLNGIAGYKLQLSPAKKLLEIYRGEDLQAKVPYEWESGEWTRLELKVAKSGKIWRVTGNIWAADAAQKSQASIVFEDDEEPPQGRASIWGSPFSGTPIQFDDFRVSKLGESVRR